MAGEWLSEIDDNDPVESWTWGDAAKSVASGAVGDIGGAAMAGVRYLSDEYLDRFGDGDLAEFVSAGAEYLQFELNQASEAIDESMTEGGQMALAAQFGDEGFWSALPLKVARMSPSILASVGAVALAPQALPAWISIGATGGALSAGQTLNDLYSHVDGMSDEELTEKSPLYAQWRQEGKSEEQARADLNEVMIGATPELLFGLGAATSVIGVPGQIARGLGLAGSKAAAGQAAKGIIRRGVEGAAIGGVAEGIQTGGEALATQSGLVEGQMQESIDYGQVGRQTAEGIILGGALGGIADATLGGGERVANPPTPATGTEVSEVEVENGGPPDIPTDAPPPPPPAPNEPPPVAPSSLGQAIPTTGVFGDVISAAAPTTQTTVEVLAPGALSAEQVGALAASQPKASALPTQVGNAVSDALEDVQQGNLFAEPVQPPPVPEPAPVASPAPVTPEVTPQVAPTTAPSTGPRILEDVEGNKRAQAEWEKSIGKNLADYEREVNPAPVQAGKIGKAAVAKQKQDAAAAAEIFAGTTKVDLTAVPSTNEAVAGFTDMLRSILADAQARDIKIPTRVATKSAGRAVSTPNELMWLREVADLVDDIEKRRGEAAVLVPRITEFLVRHNAAMDGDWEVMRESRRIEGAVKSRQGGGDVEAVAGAVTAEQIEGEESAVAADQDVTETSGTGVEKDAVATKATSTASRGMRTATKETETREVTTKGGGKRKMEAARAAGEARTVDRSEWDRIAAEAEARAKGKKASGEELAAELETAETRRAERADLDDETKAFEDKEKAEVEVAGIEEEVVAEAEDKVAAVKKKSAAKKAKQKATVTSKVKKATPKKKKEEDFNLNRTITEQRDKELAAMSKTARDKALREGTDPDPTPAQAEAGNFKKQDLPGLVPGFVYMNETAAGAIRTGLRPDGSEWSVKMPVPYGYWAGTKNTDGQQIDAYLGPHAIPNSEALAEMDVYILWQKGNDPEWKTFIGFDSEADALKAYVESFEESFRIEAFGMMGDSMAMSQEDFAAWLKDKQETTSPPVPEADITEAVQEVEGPIEFAGGILSDPMMEAPHVSDWADVDDIHAIKGIKLKRPVDRFQTKQDWLEAVAIEKTTASVYGKRVRKYVQGLKPEGAPSIRLPTTLAKGLWPAIISRLEASILDKNGRKKDIPVYILPAAEIASNYGKYESEAPAGFYAPREDAIVISEESALWNDSSEADAVTEVLYFDAAHTYVHELAHAAFYASTQRPANQNIRNTVQEIANEFIAANPDWANQYAFTNLDEFIAEMFSNPKMQVALSNTLASPGLSARIANESGSRIYRETRSLWTGLVDLARRLFRIPPSSGHRNLLEAVMLVGAEFEINAPYTDGREFTDFIAERLGKLRRADRDDWSNPFGNTANPPYISDPANFAQKAIEKYWDTPTLQDQVGVPKLLRLSTLDYIARRADSYFKGNNPVRRIADEIEKITVTGKRLFLRDAPVLQKLQALEKKYKADGTWDKFSDLLHNETLAGVYVDLPITDSKNVDLVGKDTLHGPWMKEQHKALHAEWRTLPDDLKAARKELHAYYEKRQNDMAWSLLKNRVMKLLDVEDDGLAARIYHKALTDADRQLLGDNLEAIEDAKILTKLKGPYVPLMRRGDYVVRARLPVQPPAGATLVANTDNVYEFRGPDARKRALAFASKQDGHPKTDSVWVAGATGSRFRPDPVTGKPMRVHPSDIDAEQRFRVEVQDRHVEFFETQKQALAAAEELRKQGFTVDGAVQRRADLWQTADPIARQTANLEGALKRRKNFRDLSPEMQNDLIQAMREASLRMYGSTRIQTKRLQRRNVLGASNDTTRNAAEYSHSTAGYLARLRHQPALDEAMAEMRKLADDGQYQKETTLGRSVIANEVEDRVISTNGFDESKRHSPWLQRILTASFVDKLASVSYSMVNATQPILLTTPMLAAKYGSARAALAMAKAYNDIGSLATVAGGVRDTARKFRDTDAPVTDFIGDIKARLSKREAALIDYLMERGIIDPESGFEVDKLIPARTAATMSEQVGTKVDTGIGYLEGISRQMPKAIEAINRSASAVATYRLEYNRTQDHDAAVKAAMDMVNVTQFNYSNTNAPPIFNHPLMKLSFQFKKFGLGVYQLLGQQVGKAIRNENPGDRAEAIKSLAYIAAAHTLAAGALGLPTEPIKAMVMAASATGLVDFNWEDVEDEARAWAADAFGVKGGEIVTRGVSRAVGIDLSSRLGLDSLMTFGEPASDSTDDVWSWFAEMAGGAPGSIVRDWHKGVNKLMDGDVVEAAELLVPVKTIADSIKAYRVGTEGKTSSSEAQTFTPYTVGESITRAVGFTPSREAEDYAAKSSFYRKSRSYTDERNKLMAEWFATPSYERGRLWGKVEEWNRGLSREQRLTRKKLDDYARRRKREMERGTTVRGMRTTDQTRGYFDRVEDVYGPQ